MSRSFGSLGGRGPEDSRISEEKSANKVLLAVGVGAFFTIGLFYCLSYFNSESLRPIPYPEPLSCVIPKGEDAPCDLITQESQYGWSRLLQGLRYEFSKDEPTKQSLSQSKMGGWVSKIEAETGERGIAKVFRYHPSGACYRRTYHSDTYDEVSKLRGESKHLDFTHYPGFDYHPCRYNLRATQRASVHVRCNLSDKDSVVCRGGISHNIRGNIKFEIREVLGKNNVSKVTESIFKKGEGLISEETYSLRGKERLKFITQIFNVRGLDETLNRETCQYDIPLLFT